MPQQCPEFKIGSTVATMKNVSWYGIPAPTQAPFSPYSTVRKCGDSDEKGYGYPVISWHWESMSQTQVYNILGFFANDTDATVDVYIQSYKDVENLREAATFKVKMYRPVDGEGKTLVARSRFWYSNITVRFGHCIEQ
jgi:hypothetical protein